MALQLTGAGGEQLLSTHVGSHELRFPRERAWAFRGGDYYEVNVCAWLDRMMAVAERPVLYDVGANVGYYPLRYAERAAQIYAFEPVSSTFAVLDDNVRRNGLANVEALRLGVSDAAGSAEIHLWSSSGSNTLYARDLPLHAQGRETIQLVTLDGLVAERGLPAPDVLKIDVEGAELPSLRGARELLASHRPHLVVECLADACVAAGYQPEELLAELHGHGYDVFYLAQQHDDVRLHPLDVRNVPVQDVVAFPPGSPVPAAALRELVGEQVRGFVTLAFLSDVLANPELLRAYARAVGPADDATLIVWSPADQARLVEQLPPLLAELGLDGEDAPDMLGLAIGQSTAGALVDAVSGAVLTERSLGELDRRERIDVAGAARLHELIEARAAR